MQMNDYAIIRIFKSMKAIDSDNKLAEMLGVSRGYISNIKNEKINMSEKLVIEMARIAGPSITAAWEKRCGQRIRDKL